MSIISQIFVLLNVFHGPIASTVARGLLETRFSGPTESEFVFYQHPPVILLLTTFLKSTGLDDTNKQKKN